MPILIALVAALNSQAAPNYIAERNPVNPGAGEQYRLFLRTPGRPCGTWRKVSPLLPKEDMLLSESKRNLSGKDDGCKFVFVVRSASAPGNMQFELQGPAGYKEFFEVPVAGSKAAAPSSSAGIANESGNGLAPTKARSKLKLGAPGVSEREINPGSNSKHQDTGTGL